MKKKYWLVACLSMGLMMACGGENKRDAANEDKYSVEISSEAEPVADLEQVAEIAVNLGHHNYNVTIRRYPDKSLPLVVDELEQRFYDNSVDIKIVRDQAEFMTRKVTKDDFRKYLSESDYKSGALMGMNCDTARCDAHTLYFTAQVGQAGEGPAFLILIPTNGNPISVLRDESQEDIGYKDF